MQDTPTYPGAPRPFHPHACHQLQDLNSEIPSFPLPFNENLRRAHGVLPIHGNVSTKHPLGVRRQVPRSPLEGCPAQRGNAGCLCAGCPHAHTRCLFGPHDVGIRSCPGITAGEWQRRPGKRRTRCLHQDVESKAVGPAAAGAVSVGDGRKPTAGQARGRPRPEVGDFFQESTERPAHVAGR